MWGGWSPTLLKSEFHYLQKLDNKIEISCETSLTRKTTSLSPSQHRNITLCTFIRDDNRSSQDVHNGPNKISGNKSKVIKSVRREYQLTTLPAINCHRP